MKFRKFNSLTNTYTLSQDWFGRHPHLVNEEWIITEKIHGANFAFYCDGQEVQVAKRTSFTDGGFFRCQEVIDKHSPAIMKLYQHIKDMCYADFEYIIVYGELYGQGIQREFNYGDKDFIGFDLWLKLDGDEEPTPVHKQHAFDFMVESGIPVVPVIATAKGSEILSIDPNKFTDGISECGRTEGFVIEPVVPADDYRGNRIYFKWKTEEFAEMKKTKKPPKTKEQKKLRPQAAEFFQTCRDMAVRNRLMNVVSHHGRTHISNFSTILMAFVDDILKDAEAPEGLWEDELRYIRRGLCGHCAGIIKANGQDVFEA